MQYKLCDVLGNRHYGHCGKCKKAAMEKLQALCDWQAAMLKRAEKIIGPYVRAPEQYKPLKESWLQDLEKGPDA